MKKLFEFSSRMRSFKHAGRGVWLTLKSQHNAWVHLIATMVVVISGCMFNVSRVDWCMLCLACTSVWVAETLNTAVEYLADLITCDIHPLIRNAKDVAAGAVLIAAIGATIIGLFVFGPYLWSVRLP